MHNNYVQQLHAANGMVDQYYSTTLPQLLQELDDVYHDVSAVVAETIINGADVISVKVRKNISKMDINPNAWQWSVTTLILTY